MTQVAIIGSGPAGLLAAYAVEQRGHEPVIFSKKVKSEMFGAMYLHCEIPGLTPRDPDFSIRVIKVGEKAGYAYNVYGNKNADCSWDSIPDNQTVGWNLKAVYDALWIEYEDSIQDRFLEKRDIGPLCLNYPLVLCSVPALNLCGNRMDHFFTWQPIWVQHGPAKNLHLDPEDLMYYNGIPWDGSFPTWTTIEGESMIGHQWYRFSQIDSYAAWEYSRPLNGDYPSSHRQVAQGTKPLKTNCTCWMAYKSFRRIGRFGKWEKGVLTHHAYEEALEACLAL